MSLQVMGKPAKSESVRGNLMYQKILVPLDGSKVAEGALPYVKELARRFGSNAVLLTACEPENCFGRPLRAYLESSVDELHSLGIKASMETIEGEAAKVILDFAQGNDIDLIVVSTHGHGGASCIWPMGSIANKVLRRSHIPILLIRSCEPETVVTARHMKKILVPLDGSSFAECIIPYVEALAVKTDNEVILLRVIEPVNIPPFITQLLPRFYDEKYEDKIAAKLEREVKRYLDKKRDVLKSKGVNVSAVSLTGEPSNTILQYAEDNSVSLIALATHGFSGITKWAYGSVASKIIEGSSKTTLIVRPPLPGSQD